MSDVHKRLLISSAVNSKQSDLRTKEKVTEYITNYTTINELEKVQQGNVSVLKRFKVE